MPEVSCGLVENHHLRHKYPAKTLVCCTLKAPVQARSTAVEGVQEQYAQIRKNSRGSDQVCLRDKAGRVLVLLESLEPCWDVTSSTWPVVTSMVGVSCPLTAIDCFSARLTAMLQPSSCRVKRC